MGEPGEESLCKALRGLTGRSLLDLASHLKDLEPEKIFPNGQTRHLDSSAQAALPDHPFVRRGYASPYSILAHFIKIPSGALDQHWSPLINE
jgi:hypothetical protein